MSLIDKLRKARESTIPIGDFRFTIRRPTALELYEMQSQPRGRAILPFVVGWEGVREIDLIPGGDPIPLAFDAALCAEWLPDRIDLLAPLSEAILDACATHENGMEDAKKN